MDQEDTEFKPIADVLHLDSASKVVSKANFYIIKKREKGLWNAFSAPSQVLTAKVFDAHLMDVRANYMPVIPAVIVLKTSPNNRDIQGQTWWLLLPENKEGKDQPINSWICKPQLNSFLYKATCKGLQDMREKSQEADGIYSCKQASERRKVSTVDKTELWSRNYHHGVFRFSLFSVAKATSTKVRLPCISHILQLKNSHPAAVAFWQHGESKPLIQKSHLFLSHEIETAREFTSRWLFWAHMIEQNSLISEEHFAKTAFFLKSSWQHWNNCLNFPDF